MHFTLSRRVVAAATAVAISFSGISALASTSAIATEVDQTAADTIAPIWNPSIELFDAAGNPLGDSAVNEGDVITVKGSGFDPEANIPGSGVGIPIPNDKPQGVYVTFGAVADPWRPSEGGLAANRSQVRSNTKWVLQDSVVDSLSFLLKPAIEKQAVTHNLDGTFSAEITVAAPSEIPAGGQWGIYTYAAGASGALNASQELFQPVNFNYDNTDPEVPGVVVGDNSLDWGLKQSWRDYVATVAAGTTYTAAGATSNANGTFRFTLSEESTYDAKTETGTLKYDGRVRFVSDAHGFDIVLENPWLEINGAQAELTAGLSEKAATGEMAVSRVKVADFNLGAPSAVKDGDNTTYTWENASGTFVSEGLQPAELGRYAGQATDPLSFSITTVAQDDTTPPAGSSDGIFGLINNIVRAIADFIGGFFKQLTQFSS